MYDVRVTATVCQNSITAYDDIVYSKEGEVFLPKISSIQRTGPSTIQLSWQAQPGTVPSDYLTVDYQVEDETALLPQAQIAGSLRLNVSVNEFTIPAEPNTLHICQAYQNQVSAYSCAAISSSDTITIDVYEPTNLELSVELLDTDMCASWILSDTELKTTTVESAMLDAVQQTVCDIKTVTCFSNSTWECRKDTQMAYFV